MEEIKNLVAQIEGRGERAVVVSTTDPDLPLVVFTVPTIGTLSKYTASASDPASGPLAAAIQLARVSAVHPSPTALSKVIGLRPFTIMRAVQVLLGDLGLAVSAQKKSL